MDNLETHQPEVFSYHLIRFTGLGALRFFLFPPRKGKVPGLEFSLCLFTMNLGHNVFSISRYKFTTLALVARWKDQESVPPFTDSKLSSNSVLSHWHVTMRPYRRWGSYTGPNDAHLYEKANFPGEPVIGLTVAKLKLSQTLRFTKWGKPVEDLVAGHTGKRLATVGMRPPQYFSTFSIWDNEQEMLSMVNGSKKELNGMIHKDAMNERSRKPFHHEFTTMRLLTLKESGSFEGENGFTHLRNKGL